MEFNNSVYPTKEQMDGFLEGDDNSPISMVNLLKFKDKAEYKDGRETNLTGAEAYAIYSKEVVKHLKKVGEAVIFPVSSKSPVIFVSPTTSRGTVGAFWNIPTRSVPPSVNNAWVLVPVSTLKSTPLPDSLMITSWWNSTLNPKAEGLWKTIFSLLSVVLKVR